MDLNFGGFVDRKPGQCASGVVIQDPRLFTKENFHRSSSKLSTFVWKLCFSKMAAHSSNTDFTAAHSA